MTLGTPEERQKGFALIFSQLLDRMQRIEAELCAKGQQRTASDVRCAVIESLLAQRNALRDVRTQFGFKFSETSTDLPISLEHLLYELAEVEQGRRSRMLEPRHSPSGESHFNHLRSAYKAQATALVQVLHERGAPVKDACREVAAVLNSCGFRKPGASGAMGYSAETVMDWRKDARKLKGGPPSALYKDQLTIMRKRREKLIPSPATDRDVGKIMLEDFAKRLTARAYRA